jgi:hypothetical protein
LLRREWARKRGGRKTFLWSKKFDEREDLRGFLKLSSQEKEEVIERELVSATSKVLLAESKGTDI